MRSESDFNIGDRLSVATLFEFLTSAQLIQRTQIPLVGIVTHGPFTVAHVHSSKPTQLADYVSRQHFGTRQQGSLQCPPSQTPVSHPLKLLATRVLSDQRVATQRYGHGVASDQINDTLTVCRNCDTAIVPKIHQLALDLQRSRARRDGCEQLALPA